MDSEITGALITAAATIFTAVIGGWVAIKVKAMELKAKEREAGHIFAQSEKQTVYWLWGVGGAVIGAAVALGVATFTGNLPIKPPLVTPTPQFITRLTIPSDTNLGITYDIQQTGTYTFQYRDSVFSAWPSGDSDSPRWLTRAICFRGPEIEWMGESINKEAGLFVIGIGNFSSPQMAIDRTSGAKAKVKLYAGEQLTCVVEDGFSDYFDNSGEIILDVFLSP